MPDLIPSYMTFRHSGPEKEDGLPRLQSSARSGNQRRYVRHGQKVLKHPQILTGKRGRPALHGKKLSIREDFTLSDEKIGDYYMAARRT